MKAEQQLDEKHLDGGVSFSGQYSLRGGPESTFIQCFCGSLVILYFLIE